jgi:hypothetical protein
MEMNVQETNEIHELTTAELELVADMGMRLRLFWGGPPLAGLLL